MQEVALFWSKGVSPYDAKLFLPMKEKFEGIDADDVEELDVLIVEKKAKLNCLNIDPNAPQVNCMQILNFYEKKTLICFICNIF